MSVDRLSVTVPSELGAALRALARARKDTVSTIVTEAIANEIRLAALDRALADADREFGPVPEELLRRAEAELKRAAPRKARQRPKK
jgi:predicted transcriptional regulator